MEIFHAASLRYDELFHFILLTRNNETVRLSDRHKWIAILGFEAGLSLNKNYFLFTPDELFSKSVYLLFFLIGTIIDAINKNVTDEMIIDELRKKKYVFTDTLKNKNTPKKEKFVFELKQIDDRKDLVVLIREEKNNPPIDAEEKVAFTISLNKKTFVERIKNGIYHFSEAKSYTSKKIFEHNEQEIFLNEVIREIQQSFYKTEYNENLFFSALKIDHVSYFGTNFSVLSELHSLTLNGLSCSELFPFYKWNNQGLSEPTKECSNQKSNPGTVFINVFNEYGLFFSQLKSKPELFHKILLDFENISKYNNDRERIQEKIKNSLHLSKNTMICYDTIINYDRYNYEEKSLGLVPVLITYDDYKVSDSFLNISKANKSIKNFNNTNIDCRLLSEDSFSIAYNAIWKSGNKISDSEKLIINNDFVYPFYKSLFNLEETIVEKKFEKSVEYLLSLKPLEGSYSDILKLLEHRESPRLNILYQLLEQYKTSTEKIAIVGTENTNNYLAKYIPTKYPNLNIDLLTKGRVLRNTDYDIIILTSFPGNIFLDFYYSTHAKNIHFILYPHEHKIFLKKIEIIENIKHNPALKEHLKYAYHGEKYNIKEKEVISFEEKEQIVTTFEEEIEQINRAKILEEIEKGIKLRLDDQSPMVIGKIFEFSDGNYRVFDKNSKVYTLLSLQQGNGYSLHAQKVNLLQGDDQILILDNSYGYSYDESINEILLENNELKEKYNKTQIWRQELNKFYNEKMNNIHELKNLFDKANLIRNELTIHNWLFKKYQISTMSYKKEIPFILNLIGSTLTEERISDLSDEIQEFISIRFTLGRFFKKLLIESIANGKNIYENFNESYTSHLQKNKLFKGKDNSHLIQKLFTLRNNVKFLAIVNILPEEIMLPTNSDLFKRPLRLEDIL
jgi:hypothetical protein